MPTPDEVLDAMMARLRADGVFDNLISGVVTVAAPPEPKPFDYDDLVELFRKIEQAPYQPDIPTAVRRGTPRKQTK